MPVSRRYLHRIRPVSLLLALLAVAALLVVPGHAATASPPPKPGSAPSNPTDGQLNGAAAHKAAVAAEVGRLGANVAAIQSQLRQLEAAREMAEQKLAFALSKLQQAKIDSAKAASAVVAAQKRVDEAQQQFTAFAQATYMNGSIGGVTGSLLTASDPNTLLQQNALEQYESDHQISAIGNVKAATIARSNADAAARLAVARQRAATIAAEQAKDAADAALTAAIQDQQQLNAQLASQQAELQQAQIELATLNHQRAAYLAYQHRVAVYQAYQRRQAAIRAERARQAALRAAAAERRRLAAEQRRHQQNGGGGGGDTSGGGQGGGGGVVVTPPSGGRWSAQAGIEAADRALRWRGWMYAWAGGNAYGPTYGVCAGDGAFNDCHVKGFDCSGLSLYAWAPYITLDHYAASQYWQAGSFHPSTSQLLPGDLTFWSSNGSPSGIHHVAIYIGHGDVVQAPQSGEVIQVTPLWDVDWGYLGATRPLT